LYCEKFASQICSFVVFKEVSYFHWGLLCYTCVSRRAMNAAKISQSRCDTRVWRFAAGESARFARRAGFARRQTRGTFGICTACFFTGL
jgi:hypothetical protein